MTASPEMIAAAWGAWHDRHGGKLGPGPAFVEAINAALAVCPGRLAGIREAAEVAKEGAAIATRAAQTHPEDSAARDRCIARAREASQIATVILALAEGKEG